MGKALHEFGLESQVLITIMSMHDKQEEAVCNDYFPVEIFIGLGGAKPRFVLDAVQKSKKTDIVLLSHINLLPVAWLIKKRNPDTKIIMLAHGIEVWDKLSKFKTTILQQCDKILCVSNFTANKIKECHQVLDEKLSILNNCIDPFLKLPSEESRLNKLNERYGFAPKDIILMTLSRLTPMDRYKGYDLVLDSMQLLLKKNKNIKYLLAGAYSSSEKIFIDNLLVKYGLVNNVVLTGYIPDDELPVHFAISDIYIMPSTKEGFGIVFIEAMYYGLPVIAGNTDGSTDALLQGKLGLLIEPNNTHEIATAIEIIINDTKKYIPNRTLLMKNFGYESYKRKLELIINECGIC